QAGFNGGNVWVRAGCQKENLLSGINHIDEKILAVIGKTSFAIDAGQDYPETLKTYVILGDVQFDRSEKIFLVHPDRNILEQYVFISGYPEDLYGALSPQAIKSGNINLDGSPVTEIGDVIMENLANQKIAVRCGIAQGNGINGSGEGQIGITGIFTLIENPVGSKNYSTQILIAVQITYVLQDSRMITGLIFKAVIDPGAERFTKGKLPDFILWR